jgi:ElaB/YqjD/DUF883 family membrane-anchored ribosome-binding protein
MNNESKSSGASSATTSPTPQKARTSESALLQGEAAQAQAAMRAKWSDAQTALKQAADVRAWTEKYPWWSVGAAAAAGLAAAVIVTPRRGESLGDRLHHLSPGGNGAAENGNADHKDAAKGKGSSVWDSLWYAGAGLLKSSLQSAILAAVAAKSGQHAAENAAETVADRMDAAE